MDLNEAVKAHAEWKMKFRTAISKEDSLDATTISRDDCCALGKWLHGEAKGKFGRLRSHSECLIRHAAFHREAGKVAKAINARQYDEAERMISGAGPYRDASTQVVIAIGALKHEAQL